MIESGAREVSEETVVDAIEFAHTEIKKICAAINDLAHKVGRKKREVEPVEFDQHYFDNLQKKIGSKLRDALDTKKHPKMKSHSLVEQIEAELEAVIPRDDQAEAAKKKLSHYFETLCERIFREQVTADRRRPDAREFDEIRAISIEVGVLPRAHGSAVFTRGETQALVTTTLATSEGAQRVEAFEGESKKRFMLHYNFPPFSVGEVSFLRGAGRREIGHGALAERAIAAVLPGEETWPYTVRVVSDILESNGSSSMASVCGASLSLMDAGVPLKAPVAGIAMGLVKEGDSYAILTDIAGAEDHYGDMDFKVAGTRDGITALQMDIKVPNISTQIMREALQQAKRGRLFILDKMAEVIAEARAKISAYAPRIYTVQIPVDKIRDVIGPGGKVIRGIIDATGVKIDVDDTGKVNVASSDSAAAERALQMIGDLTATPELGKTYLGKVVRLADFGAFVEIFPGTDGLLHISEVAEHRIADVRDELKEGDQVLVKVLSIEGNRIRLSRKAILKEQRAKMGGGTGGVEPTPEVVGTMTIEGGDGDFEAAEQPAGEPNFNRVEGAGVPQGARPPHPRGDRGPRRGGSGGGGGRGGRNGGRGGRDRGRR
jgi:polyribonucleotide nucleotidyltransferase